MAPFRWFAPEADLLLSFHILPDRMRLISVIQNSSRLFSDANA
ncbi:hypothetical protein X746_27845 [Mesorhizobium sp. LNJC380A00]|nr:hypothetical protein X746_27845 [Mesorhizobium sp. LNJC380A00]ESZ32055.1 hypothetical protein X732_28990 [Mesorhizobium sp. L2C066B000]